MLCLTQTVYAARENLYLTFKDNKEIKIYLEEVTDAEKNPEVSLKEFTVIFAKALSERMEKKFYFVDRAADADVLVSVNIRQYVYDEKVMPSASPAMHEPPISSAFSSSRRSFTPLRAKCHAAARPDNPPPTMATS